jgi:DNA polymerase III delta prime subunit
MNRIHLISGPPGCGKTSCILAHRLIGQKPFHESAGDLLHFCHQLSHQPLFFRD